jgi:hypothetical protein
MNPLRIAEQLRTDYLQLPTTTFAPRQERLKQDFRTAVEREGFLTRAPFVSLARPYPGAPALAELLEVVATPVIKRHLVPGTRQR